MQAISFARPWEITIIDIPIPKIGTEDVLIKTHYVGLCGSDLNTYRGLFPMVTYPRIPGHEVSGVIEKKGNNVPEHLRIGAKVTLSPYSNCNLCPACRAGRPNCCEFNETLGVQRDGALTEYIAIHYSKVYSSKLLSFKELVLAEPLSIGYHGVNRGRIQETDSVLILGCGTVGIGAVSAAVRKGAKVIALDIDNNKLKMAREFGAQYTINSVDEDVKARIKELTNNEGVSVVIEAIGLPETFVMAIDLAAFAGRVVYIGYAKQDVTYETKNFVSKELDIMGSRNALDVFPAVLKMLEERNAPFSKLITKVYSFSEAMQAFKDWDVAPGKFTKILIDMGK